MSGNERELKLDLRKGSLEMKVVISAKQNKGRQDFVSEINFSRNGKEITDLQQLDGDTEFKGLMEEYAKQVRSFDKKGYDRMIRESKGKFSERVQNVILVTETAWKGLTVLTVDSSKKPMARTTIEPDADVLTVLRPDLRSQMKVLLDIQAANVSLVNRFCKYRLFGFVRTIKDTIRLIRAIMVPAGAAATLADLYFLTFPHLSSMQTYLAQLDLARLLADPVVVQQFLLPVGIYFFRRYFGRFIFWTFRLGLGKESS